MANKCLCQQFSKVLAKGSNFVSEKDKVRIDEGNPPKPSPVLTQAKRPASTLNSTKTESTRQTESTNQISKKPT